MPRAIRMGLSPSIHRRPVPIRLQETKLGTHFQTQLLKLTVHLQRPNTHYQLSPPNPAMPDPPFVPLLWGLKPRPASCLSDSHVCAGRGGVRSPVS